MKLIVTRILKFTFGSFFFTFSRFRDFCFIFYHSVCFILFVKEKFVSYATRKKMFHKSDFFFLVFFFHQKIKILKFEQFEKFSLFFGFSESHKID